MLGLLFKFSIILLLMSGALSFVFDSMRIAHYDKKIFEKLHKISLYGINIGFILLVLAISIGIATL